MLVVYAEGLVSWGGLSMRMRSMPSKTFLAVVISFLCVPTLELSFVLPVHGALIEWKVSEGGNGHFYEAVLAPSTINWQTARDDAISKGGDLASIASSAENEFVFSLIDSVEYWAFTGAHNYGPWIGGYQIDNTSEPAGNWAWTDGTPWGYTSWAVSQPDNFGAAEHNAHYFVPANARDDTWNDWNGTGLLIKGYVLETLTANSNGDFDGDGDTDGFDFLEWQRGESPDPLSQSDLNDWEANYGAVASLTVAAAAVPEPATVPLLVTALALACLLRVPTA